jgi:aquaporin related protein
MVLMGAIGYVRGMVMFTAQMVGAMASAAVVSALFPGPLLVRTSLAPGTSITRGLFIEMFLTAELVFTMCVRICPRMYSCKLMPPRIMLAAEKHKATFMAPLGIGLALFIAEMSGTAPSLLLGMLLMRAQASATLADP